MNATKTTQYSCAVMLILSSIIMVAYQVFTRQAFLLAGSIFGLDYYIDKVKQIMKG